MRSVSSRNPKSMNSPKRGFVSVVIGLILLILIVIGGYFFGTIRDFFSKRVELSKNHVEFSSFASFLAKKNFQAGVVEKIYTSNQDDVFFVTKGNRSEKIFSTDSLGYSSPGEMPGRGYPLYLSALPQGFAYNMFLTADRSRIVHGAVSDLSGILGKYGIASQTKENSLFPKTGNISGSGFNSSLVVSPNGDYAASEVLINEGNRNSSWDNEFAIELFNIKKGAKTQYLTIGNLEEAGFVAKSDALTDPFTRLGHRKPDYFEVRSPIFSLDGKYVAFLKDTYSEHYDEKDPNYNPEHLSIPANERMPITQHTGSFIGIYDIKSKETSYVSNPIACPESEAFGSDYTFVQCGIISFVSPTEFITGENDGTYDVEYSDASHYVKTKILDRDVKLLGILL